jgi:hypothetical protein
VTRITEWSVIRVFGYSGDPNNRIWRFGWIPVSSDNPNLAIIAKNRIRRAVYRWRRESGWMGAFLIANFRDSRIFAKYHCLCEYQLW